MWTVTPKGFKAVMKILDKNASEMLKWIDNNEKPIKIPFCTKTKKEL